MTRLRPSSRDAALLVVTLVVVLWSMWGGSLSSGSAATPPEIRFGYQATIWGAPAIVAQDAHLWAKAGAHVQSITLSSGAQVRDSLLAGSLDAGSVGSIPFIVGAAKGQVVAVAVVAYAGRTDAIVVGKSSPIRGIRDLRGKKIGSQSGSLTQEVFVSIIAPRFGLASGDYRLVNMTFQDMYAALATHQIDAFAGTDPFPTLAVYNGVGRILTDYAKYDPTPLYLVFTSAFVRQHPVAVQKALEGWLRVGKLFKSDPAAVTKIVVARFAAQGTSLPTTVVQTALSHLDVTADFSPSTNAYLTKQAESLVKQGAISAVPDWGKVIDTSLLRRAEQATGIQ